MVDYLVELKVYVGAASLEKCLVADLEFLKAALPAGRLVASKAYLMV